MLAALFDALDARDADRFVAFLAADCVFRFGNLPPVAGTAAIHRFVTDFFDSISALSHDIAASWPVRDGLVCHGSVTYTRRDGTLLTVPFANVLRTGAAGIGEYLVFADTSQLYR